MSFISYAQNFEDVILWRALKHIEHGFYIDIGAQDPVIDSVSLAFYEHGWRGVHIEPTPQYAIQLRATRPDEIIEQVAIGSSEGRMIFYEFSDTGLSTADPEIAMRHQQAGYNVRLTEVPVVSLGVILDKYNHKDVHWLKIDVEGWEKNVLESWYMSAGRPWILIIESTKPRIQEQSYADWEHLVFEKGYSFAYFDGLNRFYVHQDHLELLESFGPPPNIFDNFVLSAQKLSEDRAAAVEAKTEIRINRMLNDLDIVHLSKLQFEQLAEDREKQIQAMLSSWSWRITAPMRWVTSRVINRALVAWLRTMCLRIGIKVLRRPLARLVRIVRRYPSLSNHISQRLLQYPQLRRSLIGIARGSDAVPETLPFDSPSYLDNISGFVGLNPRAQEIYSDIKSAIGQNPEVGKDESKPRVFDITTGKTSTGGKR
jgi:FkbM family methyltransferase